MNFTYKKVGFMVVSAIMICLSIVAVIKTCFFKTMSINEPIKNVISYYNKDKKTPNTIMATTKVLPSTTSMVMVKETLLEESDEIKEKEEVMYPYQEAPTFVDDGSIIYDGLTLTELTNKLNKSLDDYLTNTGYFFAEFTKDTGLDPYLSVAIVLLETGCKWKCSTLTVDCNNIGGLKGSGSCNGGSYSKYDTLDQGIDNYLNIIYKNYYLKGMTTAEEMASRYAASSQWSMKVNKYIEEIKAK